MQGQCPSHSALFLFPWISFPFPLPPPPLHSSCLHTVVFFFFFFIQGMVSQLLTILVGDLPWGDMPEELARPGGPLTLRHPGNSCPSTLCADSGTENSIFMPWLWLCWVIRKEFPRYEESQGTSEVRLLVRVHLPTKCYHSLAQQYCPPPLSPRGGPTHCHAKTMK